MKTFLIVIAVVVSGCSQTQFVPVTAPLDCPPPLFLQKATPEVRASIDELKRSDADGGNQRARDMFNFFKRRAFLQKTRRESLQRICRSTHDE